MSGTDIEQVDEVVTAELVPLDGGGIEVYDETTQGILDALDKAVEEDAWENRPKKTRKGYERDWALWEEFHEWLTSRTEHVLPLTAVTTGTLVSFVKWLDEIKHAAPSTIDRRISGVTMEARHHGAQVPKKVTAAAREALKPLRLDLDRQARGRGRATAAEPANLRAMNTADRVIPRKPKSRRRRKEYELPEIARLRDRAMFTMAFGIAGRAAEVAKLRDEGIRLGAEGLEVHVPSVKGRPDRHVVVPYGAHADSCPVRCWVAWKEAKDALGATAGPAFVSVDQWGHLGSTHMTPDSVRLAMTRAGERAKIKAKVTGHSMRAGFITTARKAGKRVEKIREQSGHEDGRAFGVYIRDAEKWTDAAGEGIGL